METPIEKALWFIESHLTRDITLDEMADVCGISRFHLSRKFGEVVCMSIRQYIRGRRLTEAARAIAGGAPDILPVALEAGFNSHEAFTRAFHEQFGMTPAAVRAQRRLDNLVLVEPSRRDPVVREVLQPPHLKRLPALSIAGLGEHSQNNSQYLAKIPQLWQRFSEHYGHVPGQIGKTAYGLCFDGSDSYHYLAGVAVVDLSGIGPALTGLQLPPQRYAAFTHSGHITTIVSTVRAILDEWLPSSGYEAGTFPSLMELYDERFDPRTGSGGLEVWLPLKA